MTLLEDKKNPSEAGLHVQLRNWAEAGPSTPTKRFVPQAENWDDDFEDKTDSPAQRQSTSRKMRTPSRPTAPADNDNWDDDFEYAEKNNTPMSKRFRQDTYVDSSDDEGEFGFGDKEEDRTVTTRSRSLLHRKSSPPPPVPALPQGLHNTVEPFPRSPSVSVFSIPTTSGRNSVGYMSTSHLALKPSASGPSLSMLPPSPPIHRERRRLRKKSRPPNLDDNVFELIEEQRDSTPPLPPSTPERSSPPPPPAAEATPSGNRTPLLSRIGSVKKWGVRRKRASTGPAEVMAHELGGSHEQEGTPRPPSTVFQPAAAPSTSSGTNTRSGWFFRPGGAPGSGSPPPQPPTELKYEKSQDDLITAFSSGPGMDASVPSTPSRKLSRRKLGRTCDPNSNNEMAESSPAKPSLSANARRPTSMQVPNGKFPSSSGAGTRHASYGSSTGRASARVFSTPTPTESVEEFDVQAQEGSRSFMGNMRKISLVGPKKHKKKKSTADVIPLPPLPAGPYPQNERNQSQQDDTRMPDLLPPIELQPPSPPRTINGKATSHAPPQNISDGLESFIIPSSSLPTSFTPRSSPMATSRSSPKSPASPPQSASLGRTTQAPTPNPSVPRRNSLGDLKIPARISQAQIGLKRDLGMVREFAASVDKLKELRSTYDQLLSEANSKLEIAPPSRATSPTIITLARTRSRLRSNTNPNSTVSEHRQFATSLQTLNNKYKIPWECAELLIELGSGSQSMANPQTGSSSTPPLQGDSDLRKGRERAITLSGDESKPPSAVVGNSSSGPPNPSWRASTGRHDLSQRQLVLLRDMLNNAESVPDCIPPEDAGVNRRWRWGDAMSSTVTLPSEDSAAGSTEGKKRRMSRLRDMLRMLKRGHSEQPPPPPLPPPIPPSTTSLSTESSLGHYSQHHYPHGQVPRRGSKASTGPDSIRSVRDQQNSPYGSPPLNHKASPRRPSLASIFRIGQKNKSTSSTGESSRDGHSEARSASRSSNMTGEDDWDRIDSAVDLDTAAHSLGIDGTATIKVKKLRLPYPYPPEQRVGLRPVTPVRGPESSQVSLRVEASPRSIRPMRSTRLSNVEEAEDEQRQRRPKSKASNRSFLAKASPHRPPSRGQVLPAIFTKSGSVRSAPPQPLDTDGQLSDFKLSMTPENIKPLLENAKEVHVRLNDCIKEMRVLLDTYVPTPS
ncbi:hypothetical protein EDD17DRAFT_1477776 [Pisolithus thermaeus]|nr:hypothetical protein EV401DRAFT_1876168 [Pisolithus croceorrhizus]KAI6162636.1 hypothetical protein EDD17DRAFT_1477776 [Pisolithus thermaeus]